MLIGLIQVRKRLANKFFQLSLNNFYSLIREEVHINVLELIEEVRKHAFEETHVLKASLGIEIGI